MQEILVELREIKGLLAQLVEKKTKKKKPKQKSLLPGPTWEQMIQPYIDSYAPSLIQDFENYWRQKNGNGKEHWQTQKVFDVGRRLSTWKRKQAKWDFQDSQRRTLKDVDEYPTHHQDGVQKSEGMTSIGDLIKPYD